MAIAAPARGTATPIHSLNYACSGSGRVTASTGATVRSTSPLPRASHCALALTDFHEVSRAVGPNWQEWIRKQIRAQPDTTLQELREQLEEAKQVRLSMGRMWLALRQLGLPLKKKHSTPRSKTVKKRSAAAKPGEKP